MAHFPRSLAVPVLLGALLAACGDDKTTIIQGGSGELGANPTTVDPVVATPTTLSFEHVIGQSPCPQEAGRVAVTNASQARTLHLEGPEHLTSEPRELALAAAQSGTVVVRFNCRVQDSFESQIRITSAIGGSPLATVVVRGTLRR